MSQKNLNQTIFQLRNPVVFAEEVLGMRLHEGQRFWLEHSNKLINILSPANQWGKTSAEAILHIYHAVCKPQLDLFKVNFETWQKQRYLTLNFGKTYEIARGVQEAILDIVEGRYLLPDGTTNQSLLSGWAITKVEDAPKLPRIVWFNNSETLIRSYDGLGESFKRLRLAFLSGDECGDIPELKLFLNGTLLPRVSFFQGSIHLIGTSQPKGIEYEEIKEEAENDLVTNGEESNYFILSANLFPEMASVYANKFMNQDRIRQIEATADPELKKQIIYGMYVDYSEHLYTWDEVSHMFSLDIPYNPETGLSEMPERDGYYAFAVDMAAAKDYTSLTCIRYNRKLVAPDGTAIELPHKIVFHKSWKGESIPLSVQYELIKDYYKRFKRISPTRTKFIYDAGSLGGKNAGDAFRELSGYPFPPKGRSYGEIKGEMFGKIKEILGRGRQFRMNEKGENIEINPEWGGIKASYKLKELRRQMESASKDDDKLRNDEFSSFGMALHFIEARTAKVNSVRVGTYEFGIS